MVAVIPVAVVVALMARGANWRDNRIGALLVVIASAVLVLLPVVARFNAWATHGIPVERYTMYLAPLMFVALVVAPGRIGRRGALISAAVVVLSLLAVDSPKNYLEQPAVYGTQTRLDKVASFFGDHVGLGDLLVTPITLGVVYALTARRRAAGLAIAAAVIAAILITQSWTTQSAQRDIVRHGRQTALPEHLDWVDRAADGPVAMLSVAKQQPWRPNIDLYTEFFNRKVKYMYSTLDIGNGACDVRVQARGYLKKNTGYCGSFPATG